jgi:hypothetical protein
MNNKESYDIFRGVGVEVELNGPDAFLKIRETLTRIGIASRKEKTLYQSCNLLHKYDRELEKSRFVILSFKELFLLDGKAANITEDDINRRNRIAKLLEEWGLVKVLEREKVDNIEGSPYIKIIPFRDKDDWNLVAKYTIGNKKRGD